MEFKGTPGPWQIKKTASMVVESTDGRSIANCAVYDNGTVGNDMVNQSNAGLIKAAPDMLEALQAAKTELEMYIPVTDVKVLDKIQAALNKALD